MGCSCCRSASWSPPGRRWPGAGRWRRSALTQLIEGDWGDTEIMLVDLPPGTGDVQLSLVQKVQPDGAVIVSTPQDLSLIDATRAIDLFGKTGVPVLGMIENMAGYQCPHCGETSDPFGSGGAEAAATELGIAFLGRLPLSREPARASDAGTPPAAGEGPAADAFARARAKIARRAGYAAALKHWGGQETVMPLTRDEDIAELLSSARTIAMVGASDRPDRPSYRRDEIPPGPGLSRDPGQSARSPASMSTANMSGAN